VYIPIIRRISFYIGFSVVLLILATGCSNRTAKSQNEIRIGSLLVLSGQYKSFGDILKQGITVAEKRIAEQGGVPLRMFVYDHQYDKSVVEEKLSLLKADKVHYIAELVGSGLCLNALPTIDKNDMVVLSAALIQGCSLPMPAINGSSGWFPPMGSLPNRQQDGLARWELPRQ
jgi:hypothetical protein